jgi:Kef-type K+ transport system membrane component KefB
MDLGLLKSEMGTLIMTATIVDDLINWTLFAIVLSEISPASSSTQGLPLTILTVVVFFVLVLGLGRWLGPRSLRWVRGHVTWPSGFIAVTSIAILVAGSISEGLGIHAFLGAFLLGAALGGHDKERNEYTILVICDELLCRSISSPWGCRPISSPILIGSW